MFTLIASVSDITLFVHFPAANLILCCIWTRDHAFLTANAEPQSYFVVTFQISHKFIYIDLRLSKNHNFLYFPPDFIVQHEEQTIMGNRQNGSSFLPAGSPGYRHTFGSAFSISQPFLLTQWVYTLHCYYFFIRPLTNKLIADTGSIFSSTT